MTPKELALDILSQELKPAETLYKSLCDSRLQELNGGLLSFGDFVENSCSTIIAREVRVVFYKIVLEEVKYYMEKENKTIVQALDESYQNRLEDCHQRGRSINNCTCALTNASKGIKLATISQLVDDYRSIINYIKKEIKA